MQVLRCTASGESRDDLGATVRVFESDGSTPVGPIQEVNGASGHGSQNLAILHFGLPDGPDRTYVVKTRFSSRDPRRSSAAQTELIRQTVVPGDLRGYQLLTVETCPSQR